MHVSLEAEHLTVHWTDNSSSQFPYLWLHDTDPAGFHPKTGERTFDLTSVPHDIQATSATIVAGELIVNWPNTKTPSCFSLEWIRTHQPGQRRADPAQVKTTLWRGELDVASMVRYSAADLMKSDEVLGQWLKSTKRDGLSIVYDLSDSTEASQSIAKRVGQLRNTNFGTTFEVISKSDPNNLAYTAEALPLHTDLTNQEMPPGYQFLHCLANDAAGGGSLFCDGFAVATDLQATSPKLVEKLANTLVPFRFQDKDTDIRSRKHVITRDAEGCVNEICFNAHLADILDLEPNELSSYYAAYRRFMTMTRSPEYMVSYRLMPGEMVVFDNRRILHGREAFEQGSGNRHLHGCYVDRADWDSRLRVVLSRN